MRKFSTLLLVLGILNMPSVVSAQSDTTSKRIDLTGKWTFTVMSDAGTSTPTVTIKHMADSLSGHYSSQTLGERDFRGFVKGKVATFTFAAEIQGTTITVTYTCNIETADSMRGTVDFGGMATGTFSAKKN